MLQLLAEGKTTKDIASELFLSVKTIETYRHRIMDRLDIHNLADLIKFAIREGLTSLENRAFKNSNNPVIHYSNSVTHSFLSIIK